MAELRPGQSLEHLLTPHDLEMMGRALDAEARGDAAAAWELHMAGLIVEESLTHHCLAELACIGDGAPAWMCSRWAVDQALRWLLVGEDPRCGEVVRLVLAGVHLREVEPFVTDAVAFQEYGTAVAASDWVYQQLAAFEFGGLRDFLDVRAGQGLLERLDQIDEWERSAVTAYELLDVCDDVLRARRMTDDQPVELLNLGAMVDVGPPRTVLGRVVPVSVWPFAMFESRPLPVDRVTAEAVAERMRGEDDLGWFWGLCDAYEGDRLPAGATFGHSTLWSTDIVPERGREPSQAGRVQDLVAAGLSEQQANSVCVVELGLIIAEVAGDIGPVASQVTAVLMDPSVHDALKKHSVAPGRGHLWRILASGTPSPVRERCLELAELSERLAA